MSKLHYCVDGTSVTEKVLLYQKTKKNDDYIPVKKYYDNFRDWWYRKLCDYMDRDTFDSEFGFKLCKAINTFNEKQARLIAKKYNLNFLGMFNRWFYRILSNWGSNAKSSSFRVRKRPPVQCPVCNRWVPRIDEDHLAHYKTISDLPKFFVLNRHIYQVETSPGSFTTVWGEYSRKKIQDLQKGDIKKYVSQRRKVRWLFFQKDKKRGVVCPFTKKIVPAITNEYLRELDKKHNRYAKPMTWFDFQEEHPMVLIQAEIYSVDYERSADDMLIRDSISKEYSKHEADHTNLGNYAESGTFEHAFTLIDTYVTDESDQKILKLVAIGYSIEDIADVLEMEKQEIRKRIRDVRDYCMDMEVRLLE